MIYAVVYWQCQSADVSVTPASVMMTSYRSSVVCVLLCLVCAVASVKIKGAIMDTDNQITEVEVSEYINGDIWNNTRISKIRLYQLVDEKNLTTLTVTNVKSQKMLKISDIALENIPAFINVSAEAIYITATKIKSVSTNAFAGALVRHIYLEKNQIQTMSTRSINTGVTEVHLRCNKLKDFSPAWFKDPSSVRILHLNGNRIESIENHAFNRMTDLSELYLDYNHIKRIGSEAFGAAIAELHLEFNDIEQLSADMFVRRNEPMDELKLHHNQLSFLPEELLVKLKPNHIALDGNPWQCQCLRDIERWLRELNIERYYLLHRRDEPACVVPRSFQNSCVPIADKELQQTYAKGLSLLSPRCFADLCANGCLPS